MAKCKSCAAGVSGMDDIPVNEIAAAVASAIALGQVDKALTVDAATGAPKDNFLTKNPMIKNFGYLGIGVMLTSMPGELYRGAGIGAATFGGYALISGFLEKPAGGAVGSQVDFIRPQNINGVDYGINPSVLGQHSNANKFRIPKQWPKQQQQQQAAAMDEDDPIFAMAI